MFVDNALYGHRNILQKYRDLGKKYKVNGIIHHDYELSFYDKISIERISGKCIVKTTIPEIFLIPGFYKISLYIWHKDLLFVNENKSMYFMEISGSIQFHAKAIIYLSIQRDMSNVL